MQVTSEVKLIQITEKADQVIARGARVCYDSIENPKLRDEALILSLLTKEHFSVFEHASATFMITGISRACSHQLVRHRIASYSQRSQRFCKEIDFDYVIPHTITNAGEFVEAAYKRHLELVNEHYNFLIRAGVTKEDARFVLPNACATEIQCTFNFRSLFNFFNLRCDKHAQWEIREVANKMLELVKKEAPLSFQKYEVGVG